MALAVAVSTALATGFLAGSYLFRRTGRWCPTCGVTNVCPLGHRADDGAATR